MKLSIRGPIVSSSEQWIYDWFGIEAVSPKKVADFLAEVGDEDFEMDINSGGGSVYDASEIYTLIKQHPGNVTGKIVALAASAASVIAMAADKILMAPTAQMMIHNATVLAQGDYRDMDKTSDFLKNVNQTIANAYNIKSGKSYEELLSMMDEETWLTPQKALEHNLIDEIMFTAQSAPKIVASADGGMIPQEIITKMQNELQGNITLKQDQRLTNETTNIKEEVIAMNLEDLKNNHPDLYNQVKNEGYESGVAAENTRIKGIEDLQIPGNEELITKAKFESKSQPADVAVQIIMAEKQRGQNFLQNRKTDSADLNNFKGGDAPPANRDGNGNEADMILNVWGVNKGGTN